MYPARHKARGLADYHTLPDRISLFDDAFGGAAEMLEKWNGE
jgi:hypothetical protein